MPRIAGVATATPPHGVSQEATQEFILKVFGPSERLRRLMPVFENSQVERRYLAKELGWFVDEHDFTEVNDLYIETALGLMEKVVLELAENCGVETTDFDALFFISTTGLSTPSLDARLFNRLKLNPHIRRVPVWGLGCAGGAAGLARAHDYLRAYPSHRALVVTVELCSLSFQRKDLTKSGVISAAIFGDGAAACLLVGDEVKRKEKSGVQPSVLGSLSTLYPKSEEVMGWRVTSDGFQVQLSKDIPSIVKTLVKKNIDDFLEQHQVSLEKVFHFILHPGGMKVLHAYSEGLGISPAKLEHSADVLREYGNMSSATVLFVLKRFLEKSPKESGEYGVLASLGPGFCSEILLLKWD